MRGCHAWLAALRVAVVQTCAAAGLVVPGGTGLKMGSGSITASGDVRVTGRLDLGSGRLIGVSGFRVDSSGTHMLGSGSIQLSGDWTNAGSVVAGSSQVRMIDGSSADAAIFGSTIFANLSIISSVGKRYLLQAGLTQSVAGLLDLHGLPAAPLQLASTVPGQVANLNLLPSGSQSISNIGVSDVHATGQQLLLQCTRKLFDAIVCEHGLIPTQAFADLSLEQRLVGVVTLVRRNRLQVVDHVHGNEQDDAGRLAIRR